VLGRRERMDVLHASLMNGTAGMRDFSDENARDPVIVALRDRVVATIDPAVMEEQVRARITLEDGRVVSLFVEQGVLPDAQARALVDMCWKVESLPGAAALAAPAVPRA
jgi:2-methylcitrate dehydratase PrpD